MLLQALQPSESFLTLVRLQDTLKFLVLIERTREVLESVATVARASVLPVLKFLGGHVGLVVVALFTCTNNVTNCVWTTTGKRHNVVKCARGQANLDTTVLTCVVISDEDVPLCWSIENSVLLFSMNEVVQAYNGWHFPALCS